MNLGIIEAALERYTIEVFEFTSFRVADNTNTKRGHSDIIYHRNKFPVEVFVS